MTGLLLFLKFLIKKILSELNIFYESGRLFKNFKANKFLNRKNEKFYPIPPFIL